MKRTKSELERALDKLEVARVALSVIHSWAEIDTIGTIVLDLCLTPKAVLRITTEALLKLREA